MIIWVGETPFLPSEQHFTPQQQEAEAARIAQGSSEWEQLAKGATQDGRMGAWWQWWRGLTKSQQFMHMVGV